MIVLESLENISLAQIAPPSIKYDKNVSAIIEALDPELRLIVTETQQLFILSRIDELDEKVLDLLAWQFHVDFYDLAKDITTKRKQVKDSIQWHMKKGTAWAIVKALDMIGVDAEFINWYEFGGEPYTFKIKANIRPDFFNYGDKEQIIQNILRAINESKAARSLLAKLDAHLIDEAKSRLYVGIAQGKSGLATMLLDRSKAPETTKNFAGMISGLSGRERINLTRPSSDETDIKVGFAENKNFSLSLGVDLDIMQELLEQFEKRIFERLEQHENRIMADFDARQQEINLRIQETNLKIDEILELLKWA